MKKVNIFNRKVSVFYWITDREPGCEATILEMLKEHGCEDLVEKYRKSEKDEDKKALPLFTCSGTFSTKTNDGLIKHNGVICIDIDKKGNTDVENFDEIPSLMNQIPNVAYCGHSCGGEGYFVLMPIEDTEKHLQHYESACDDFERCGITVDRVCKNVSRTRFISFDYDAYYNYEAVVYTRAKETGTNRVKTDNKKIEIKRSKKRSIFGTHPALERIEFEDVKWKVEFIITLIERDRFDITAIYNNWVKIGAALANQFGEDGREYFHRVSRFYPKYDKNEADNQFTSCMQLENFTIGSFFYVAKEYGYSMF